MLRARTTCRPVFRPLPLLGLLAIAIGLTVATLTPTVAAAAPAAMLDSKDNAALKYWRAFSLISEDQRRALGGAVFSLTEYGLEFEEGEQAIEVDTLLDDLDFVVEMLVEGSRLPGCDFSVDWHLGVEALLPELSPMRTGARLLMLDAARELNSGDPDAAAERVAGVIRMSHHAARDPVLISALVGLAMFRAATDFAIEGERAGVWTDEGRTAFAQALARFSSEDPFSFIRAMRGEERWVGDWMEQRLDNEWSTPESFIRDAAMLIDIPIASITPVGPDGQIEVTFEGDGSDARRVNTLLQAEDFRAAIKREIELYRLAVRTNTAVWNNPDAAEHFERFTTMLTNGEFGVITQIMLPSFERSHQQDMESRQRLEELRLMFRAH